MQAVQDAFGSETVIINNKNQNMEAVSMLKWTDPSMDTTRIGWITTINPTFDNREQSQIRFCEVALYSKLLAKKVKIPMFQMSFVSPTAEKDRNTISTKAYAAVHRTCP